MKKNKCEITLSDTGDGKVEMECYINGTEFSKVDLGSLETTPTIIVFHEILKGVIESAEVPCL